VATLDAAGPGRSESRFVVDFPRFWIGPVWLTLVPRGRVAAGRVRFEWGAAVKDMVVESRATVTCRRPMYEAGALVVRCPAGWRVVAGMGHDPEARDVNFGWVNQDDPEAEPAPTEPVNELFLNWFGRTVAEFRRFLDRHPAPVTTG
jgi:hypothetical protein